MKYTIHLLGECSQASRWPFLCALRALCGSELSYWVEMIVWHEAAQSGRAVNLFCSVTLREGARIHWLAGLTGVAGKQAGGRGSRRASMALFGNCGYKTLIQIRLHFSV